MKTHILTIALLSAVFHAGCISFTEHGGLVSDLPNEPFWEGSRPPVFPGTARNLASTALGVYGFLSYPFLDYPETKHTSLLPLYIVDLGPSFIADILYLPGDLQKWKKKHKELSREQSDGEATSKPAPVPGASSEASHP